ncbi:MAG: hypothetical protein A3G52_01040 [Candidatus Taylorbacteria bacterium RIFCSPLOWO2_12_FULL_43_20]|uniref:Uncharacterized protein n=1 Tax=Candidatus Taylorbacteria bacterium RIFCSPLOWO2_12_FULL_43_20 TaxID=1802332 RepID=A0A1G2P3D2_9BACT|nr:MAG: hypothetical protein A3H58_00340 [Candidatus Taylorbacteria bacterium RIFCSPLOWO2_02_FULL_43_22b]OHA42840.1 MAG: hypothetical protein A3G52_01040 [Candidatus Taylorbacteria bacterium RIFCSPLOWO2_12_FULL_43_20]
MANIINFSDLGRDVPEKEKTAPRPVSKRSNPWDLTLRPRAYSYEQTLEDVRRLAEPHEKYKY